MSQTGHSLLIGTYTETLPHVTGTAAGILGATYDPLTGSVRDVAVLARTRNPSYLAVGPDGRRVYAVNETHRFAGQPGGGVTAFARDPGIGALRELNFVSSGGEAPCFVSMDGRVVLVANYDSGSVTAIALEPDGSLGPGHATVQHAGSSVNAERQEGPHVHMAIPDPVTGDALVVDLGQDAVLTYQLGDSGLAERPGTRFAVPPGAGPRHIAFHPDGQHLFVVCELGNVVLTLRRADGKLVLAHVASTLPPGAESGPPTLAGAIRVTPSGRYVLVSNRGHDSMVMLRFDAETPALTLVHAQPSGGACPRDFCLTPEADRLIIAHQDSHNLVIMDLDEDRAELRPVSTTAAPTPSSVVFAP
jgi:6-phosphogluconolactonase